MQKIKGRLIAQQILNNLKLEIQTKDLHPKLAILLVGDDPASHIYVKLKEKKAHQIGIKTDIRRLPANTPDKELKNILTQWNKDPQINGIIIQLPLPSDHNTNELIKTINPQKDVDGFHPQNIEDLKNNQATILSPLHEGILRLIASTPIIINHSLVTLLVNSEKFAEPLKYIFQKAGATVNIMLATNKDDKILRKSNIIIVAVGQAKFLTSNGVNNNQCIIDVGINKLPNNKICGDFDSLNSKNISGWYSPVPGGVGPMTVALLMKNTVELYKRQHLIV